MRKRNSGSVIKRWVAGLLVPASMVVATAAHAAQPLKVGYSNRSGLVAWQVAIEKNWFKDAKDISNIARDTVFVNLSRAF